MLLLRQRDSSSRWLWRGFTGRVDGRGAGCDWTSEWVSSGADSHELGV